MDVFQCIKEFHQKFQLEYNGQPRPLPRDLGNFRTNFMEEELYEYFEASRRDDLAKQLDALVDLVYVAVGTAYLHGFDFNEAFRRVHEANMLKVRAERAEQSTRNHVYDVVKPEGWTPPDLSDLVVAK